MTQPDIDPFADAEKVPSLTFKDSPIGTVQTGTVTKLPAVVQSRDYETGQPAVWDDGNPKMSVVIGIDTDDGPRAIWAAKPSSLYAAIGAAQTANGGKRIALGDTIAVKYLEDKPNAKNPRLNAQKIYAVKITPAAVVDPFATAGAAVQGAFAGASDAPAPPF